MFIKDKIFYVLNILVNFGSVITNWWNYLKTHKQTHPILYAYLSTFTYGIWILYLAVDKDVEHDQNITTTDNFCSKVYKANFNKTSEWIKNFETKITDIGLKQRNLYMWYTATCTKCTKKIWKKPFNNYNNLKKENMLKESKNDCCNSNRNHQATASGGAVYGFGFIGAAIYFISQASTFWLGVLGFLKALVWPAILVFEALKTLGC